MVDRIDGSMKAADETPACLPERPKQQDRQIVGFFSIIVKAVVDTYPICPAKFIRFAAGEKIEHLGPF